MNYKIKQSWIEAVMADTNLTPAAKVYAYGIFQHMYGNKDEAFPGATALTKATGLNDSQFYRYNRTLTGAGYLEVTSRKGTSNEYRLIEPTSNKGGYLPSERVTLPSERVGGTSTEGTNTTKKTTTKTSKEDINGASAPVNPSLGENIAESILNQSPSFEEVVQPLLDDSRFSLVPLTHTADTAVLSVTEEATVVVLSNADTLSDYLVEEITQQVGLISLEEKWDDDFQAQVLAIALDPAFLPKNVSVGSRVFRAKQHVRNVASAEAW